MDKVAQKVGDPRFNLSHPKDDSGKFSPKGIVRLAPTPEVKKGSDLSK